MVLLKVLQISRHAVDLDVRRTYEGHDVKPADLDPLQVGIGGLFELHGDVGFKPEHVRRTHLAFQVHQQP